MESYSEESNRPGRFKELAESLSEIGRGFYARGWALGTSGNFSSVVSMNPLRLAITSSSVDKSLLTSDQILQINADGKVVEGVGRPSAESLLHIMIVRVRGAGAVLHTHSVWSNIISDAYARDGGVQIESFEMLKGLEGVHTHEHREWLPIIENSQDMEALAHSVEQRLNDHPDSHGLLLRRHGLYTWGRDLAEAKRHVEILEFLLEVLGRMARL
ncbi:MAG TPA: methylthioribulose 1-phosphate dehydratase [Blastocatellia bacterium]|nr:methylthioribulose 1-phosphate dehydratase [Blastocatellia bacterium]